MGEGVLILRGSGQTPEEQGSKVSFGCLTLKYFIFKILTRVITIITNKNCQITGEDGRLYDSALPNYKTRDETNSVNNCLVFTGFIYLLKNVPYELKIALHVFTAQSLLSQKTF